MYDRIEVRPEAEGVRVLLHNGSDRIADFIYCITQTADTAEGRQSIIDRVSRIFNVPTSVVEIVTNFSTEG